MTAANRSELTILKQLWVKSPRSAREVQDAISGETGWSYSTTRTLLTRIDDWQVVAAVHGEFFGGIRPANTIMEVSRFIDPDWLVEFEADAIVSD